MTELGKFRGEIDKIDDQIVTLLAKRFAITREIGAMKAASGMAVRDSTRERELFAALSTHATQVGVDPDLVERIYRSIIDVATREQEQLPPPSLHQV